MLGIPPIAEWNALQYTMSAYMFQGGVIALLNIPLIVILLRKQNRARKEFILIACVSIIDIFYVVVNSWNSFVRLTSGSQPLTRAECVLQPSYFVSLVASQLVANMPMAVALDRLIATLFGVWYYKQGNCYSLFLCAVPISFSFLVTVVNLILVLSTSAGKELVPSFCFSSTLPAPDYKLTFHSIKWICIVLAGVVYLAIAGLLRTQAQSYTSIPGYAKRIRTANIVMGLNTVNSLIFHLIPDVLLVVPLPFLTITIQVQCILYSAILEKIMFNFVLFLVFHKELRLLYCSTFFRAQEADFNSCGTANRLVPERVRDDVFRMT